ncbi:hypothetical protein FFLO_04422 [Filobasidium floriforme]|uniref:Uncharacterized protein n=1 Tax=Filobasidium floriforme TaxID=5210 RepID=A0A8K0NPA9_9TREE|nr:uncharacterized protein HD553DRAFT_320244 [Filobasidium floriforme]KAG7531361.1 hypothetical protein FFLO_04422 [Filobasidium floriforme]KAH8078000.1 hypothetical protein HD553DRAFT_320244 [Filobasidium floriforme]
MLKTVEELEQDLATVWNIVNQLSEQISNNNQLLSQLRSQSALVKGQAAHTGVGFPLRRFNIDISDEEFSTQLEEFASHLVLENQTLTYENKQLNILLKDYENVLEGVMGKFRSVSHAATKHELSLHQYYTSLLHSLRTAQSSQQLLDSTTLSLLLQRLSTLIRMALRNVNGEEDMDGNGSREEWELLGAAAASIEELNLGASLSPAAESSQAFSPATSIAGLPSTARPTAAGMIVSSDRQTVASASHPPRAPSSIGYDSWQGNMTPSGGYPGTFGRRDWALDREEEIVRLTSENAALREMLGVEADVDIEAVLAQSRAEAEAEAEAKQDEQNVKEEQEADMVDVDLADDKSGVKGYDIGEESTSKETTRDMEESGSKPTAVTPPKSPTEGQVSAVNSTVGRDEDEDAKDFFSTSPKHTVSRISMKSPRLAKHHTYTGIPTTATTPLSPSAIRDVSMAGKVSEGSDRNRASGGTTPPPGLATHASTGNMPNAAHSSTTAHSSASSLSFLLSRPGGKAKTKTEPTTATSIGVDLDDEDTVSPPMASYAAMVKPHSKMDSVSVTKEDAGSDTGAASQSEKQREERRKSAPAEEASPADAQTTSQPAKAETPSTDHDEVKRDDNESAVLDDDEEVGESPPESDPKPTMETYAEVASHEEAKSDQVPDGKQKSNDN